MTTPTIEMDALQRSSWTPDEAANAALVADFVRTLMNQHDFEAVQERYGSHRYLQHNHGIADGIDGVVETVAALVKRFPDYAYDVRHVLVDDDIVTFHSHATLRSSHRRNPRKGFNITDRWRIANGEIVEHWDSIQPIDRFARLIALVTGSRVRNNNGTY
ncbi:MAG: ester cyclase [Actinomycetota bacterium]